MGCGGAVKVRYRWGDIIAAALTCTAAFALPLILLTLA